MADLRVSVIVATFNYSTVLPYSIASALAQTVPPLEVLVVGDHCTDDSAAVVAAIGDDRVRFINLAHHVGMQSGPNNEGLAEAHGEVVAYLGHDDLWLPHHLAHLLPVLEAGADVAYEMALLVSPGRAKTVWPRSTYRSGAWIPPTVVAHRRRASERVGGWRLLDQLQMDPDCDIWARMHDAGQRIAFVPRVGAVKFPASHRRHVYVDRPCEEQAAWAARIASEPDLEATETALLLGPASLAAAAAASDGRELIPTLASELVRRGYRHMTGPSLARLLRRKRDFRREYEDRRRFRGLS